MFHTNRSPEVFLFVAVLMVLVVPCIVAAVTPFVSQSIDVSGDVGLHTSLAIDANGNRHISYYDNTALDLKYAVRMDGVWTIETVDAGGNVGHYSSIAVDANGNPHISYQDVTNSDLKYAVKTGGVWSTETVDAPNFTGFYSSLALDANGHPHICYSDGTTLNLRYAVNTGGGWTIETAASTGDVGQYCAIALDPSGNPHASYHDGTNGEVVYASRASGAWVAETIENLIPAGNQTDIAVDNNGIPHVVYRDVDFDLRYAQKLSGSWSTNLVDGSDGGVYASIALDVNGNPHVGYDDVDNDDLKYAFDIGGGWVRERIDVPGLVGEYPSIALDSQGNPHISYYDVTNGNLKYADSAIHLTSPVGGERWIRDTQATVTWDGTGTVDISVSTNGGVSYTTLVTGVSGGSAPIDVPGVSTIEARVKVERASPLSTSTSSNVFTIEPKRVSPLWTETSDAPGNVGLHSSIALSAGNVAHVSYQDVGNADLRYAIRTGNTWTTETVEAVGSVGEYTSIDIFDGAPHISFRDVTNLQLRYAVKTSAGTWSQEIADAAGNTGLYTSLRVDMQGNPHIAYYDLSNADLRYAVRSGGWSTETVDAAGFVGSDASLALDELGNPHISYFDGTNNDLKYAVKQAGSWSIETVDATGTIGLYTSIVVTSDDLPMISYYDLTNGDLKCATKTGGSWDIEIVDATGDVGQHTSIVITVDGFPVIAYYDNTNDDLKLATKCGDDWIIETVDATGDVGTHTSLRLDAQGNPHITYRDQTNLDLKYATGALAINNPAPGSTWPVGATRSIAWGGSGAVDVSLSVDGGNTYTELATNISGGSYDLVVPHTPSKFSRVRIERREDANDFGSYVYRHSIAESDSLFTIETSVSLLNLFVYEPQGLTGLTVSWSSDPGPEDLSGYRLEKGRADGAYVTLVSRTKETEYHDRQGKDGDIYRLFAINGLGDEFYLGETSGDRAPSFNGPIASYPVPFRGGELTIDFALGTFGGTAAQTEVAIYDVRGRRVATVAKRRFEGTVGRVTWDGRDDRGNLAASGVYFIRVHDERGSSVKKIAIVR